MKFSTWFDTLGWVMLVAIGIGLGISGFNWVRQYIPAEFVVAGIMVVGLILGLTTSLALERGRKGGGKFQ